MINKNTRGFYSGKYILASGFLSALYLLVSFFLIGFKTDQVFALLLCNCLFFATNTSRKLIIGFSIFLVYWIIFDYMKALPNYRYNAVHIESLYNAEKYLFGFNYHGIRVTPNEYFRLNTIKFLDVVSGIFYLCWVPVPLGFAAYLFFANKTLFFNFSLSFLLVNLLGFVGYYVFPAAPPWYVQLHGFTLITNTPGNSAGLAAFDKIFHVSVFKALYAKSSNVFAAMPSLHSSYPLIVVYYSRRTNLPVFVKSLMILVVFGIWFGAVYSSHHYVLDVLAGIATAATGIAMFTYLLRFAWMKKFIDNFIVLTS